MLEILKNVGRKFGKILGKKLQKLKKMFTKFEKRHYLQKVLKHFGWVWQNSGHFEEIPEKYGNLIKII